MMLNKCVYIIQDKMAIYDFIQSTNYIYPVIINNGLIYAYDFKTNGSTQVSVTFKGSEGSPEYYDLEWKTYDWGIDYAYAIAYDEDSIAYSIAINSGFGIINSEYYIMPEEQNEFTTKTSKKLAEE